jgi:hypothetical protein
MAIFIHVWTKHRMTDFDPVLRVDMTVVQFKNKNKNNNNNNYRIYALNVPSRKEFSAIGKDDVASNKASSMCRCRMSTDGTSHNASTTALVLVVLYKASEFFDFGFSVFLRSDVTLCVILQYHLPNGHSSTSSRIASSIKILTILLECWEIMFQGKLLFCNFL